MKEVKTVATAVKPPRNPFTSEVAQAWGIRDVEQYTGLTRVAIWKHTKLGAFPAPRYVLGNRKWWKAEIEQWVADQDKASVKPTALGSKRTTSKGGAR